MKTITLIAGLVLSVLLAIPGAQETALPRSPAPAGAMASLHSPADAATVSSPFTVRFGLTGVGVAPAGVESANTGHHHLLVNVDTLPSVDVPLPATEQILHFGGGQTETQLELAPGEYTLQVRDTATDLIRWSVGDA